MGSVTVASAHHTFAVYDFSEEIPFEGAMETLNVNNPHVAVTLTCTLGNGETETIDLTEGAPANMPVRKGLQPSMIEPATRITAAGSPLRKDRTKFFLRKLNLRDGREFQ